ncbi:T9SS type A sorting domain-containing protein [Massilibacteroides vaginae]|uniref:T9SS type A sorting domain-containing protein n=1 Tax=Massilibacteroides vaginae TaxID=1673718 RepID=UPI000A1C9684|nr:T9SS type A sorting domain-containing protein [Massilibacteroides vaginae]
MKMKKNIFLTFFFFLLCIVGSLERIQAQSATDKCDIEIAAKDQYQNSLDLKANKIYCITGDLEYSDISWADGITLRVASGKKLTIRNNMANNNSSYHITIELYGVLEMGNPEFNPNLTLNVHSGGEFTTTGNTAFKGENVTINNDGKFDVHVLNLNGNDSKISINNNPKAQFIIEENLNVGSSTALHFQNQGKLDIKSQFGLSPKSVYSNCGIITTKGFNLQGGKIYNTGQMLIEENLDGSGDVYNYGVITLSKIQGSGKSFYNHGKVEVLSNTLVDMDVLGPTVPGVYGEFSWNGKVGGVNNIRVSGNQLFKNTKTGGGSNIQEMLDNTSAIKPLESEPEPNIQWGDCADCKVNFTGAGCFNPETGEKEPDPEPEPDSVNYWIGGNDPEGQDWDKERNWTGKKVPVEGENVEFATVENNKGKPAVNDLYLDTDRVIGDLINNSDKDLIIPTGGNQLKINGEVKDDNSDSGTIIIKASPTEPAGSLIFRDPDKNKNVQATVEFYNKAYDCATCGFYTRSWQYFGVPVQSSVFPYDDVEGDETVNRWDEPTNGNKWVLIEPATLLEAFKGYEMTNDLKAPPTGNYRYEGALNVGDASVPLTYTASVNYPGMNLIGNSYTAAIPITSEAIDFAGTQTVYLFNTGTRDQWRKLGGVPLGSSEIKSGGYTAVPLQLAGSAGVPGVIPSMHAFMVSVPSGNDLTLKYDKLVKNELVADGVSTRSAGEVKEKLPYIVMDVIGDESADRVWLFENILTTRSFDNGWDGRKIIEKGLVQIYVDGDDNKYQVATVPELEGTDIGLTPDSENDYTLHLSVLPEVEARGLYLYDRLSKRTYPIRNNAGYVIVGGKPAASKRFTIVSDIAKLDDTLGINLVEVEVVDNSIRIVNSSNENCTAVLYDLTGRALSQRTVATSATEYIQNSTGWQTGVYIIKLIGTQKVNVSKRILIK